LAKQDKPATETTAGWQKYRLAVAMTMVTSTGMILIGVAAFQYWTGKPWSTLHHFITH